MNYHLKDVPRDMRSDIENIIQTSLMLMNWKWPKLDKIVPLYKIKTTRFLPLPGPDVDENRDWKYVERMANNMDRVPPIVADEMHLQKRAGQPWDGRHRIHAAILAKRRTINAIVLQDIVAAGIL